MKHRYTDANGRAIKVRDRDTFELHFTCMAVVHLKSISNTLQLTGEDPHDYY